MASKFQLSGAVARQATEQAQQLGATGPDQPEQPEDFAFVHLETHWLAQPRPEQSVDLECHRAALARAVIVDVLDVAPDHAGDQLIVGQLAHVIERAHVAPVLEHRHRVADAEHFFHAMGDIEHHFALVPQPADDRHQAVDLPRRKAAGGFVEGDDMGATGQRLGDFHQLPLAERQAPDFLLRVDFIGQAFEAGQCLLAQSAAIDQAETGWQMPEKQVLGHGHFRHQMQLLVDHRDATADAVGGGLEVHRPLADLQGTAARRVGPAENFQQRRLAGAVLAHQGVNLPRMGDEADVVQRLHPGKGLADPVEAQAAGKAVFVLDCLRVHNHLFTPIRRPRRRGRR
ncbi:hypothetical protein D3C72_1139550 [compost metagenome]